jgi:hypothetical protein
VQGAESLVRNLEPNCIRLAIDMPEPDKLKWQWQQLEYVASRQSPEQLLRKPACVLPAGKQAGRAVGQAEVTLFAVGIPIVVKNKTVKRKASERPDLISVKTVLFNNSSRRDACGIVRTEVELRDK